MKKMKPRHSSQFLPWSGLKSSPTSCSLLHKLVAADHIGRPTLVHWVIFDGTRGSARQARCRLLYMCLSIGPARAAQLTGAGRMG
jgi:hypothetical protein